MFMNKEDADAIAEQQTREFNNLKAMKMSERERIIKIIKDWEKYILKPNKSYIDEDLVEELIERINSQHPEVKACHGEGETSPTS